MAVKAKIREYRPEDLEQVLELVKERDPLYRQVADMVVSTERRGTPSVVKEIRRRLESDTP